MRLFALAVLLLAPARAHALGESAGTTAVPMLQVPMGARAFAMGTAFTAVASDVSILHYNPAGLANLSEREATMMYLDGRQDPNLEYFAGERPLPFRGFTGSGFATVGASVLFSQNGQIDVRRTNPDGSFAGQETLNAGNDIVTQFAYAERVADTPLE